MKADAESRQRLDYPGPGEIPERVPVFAVKEIRQALRSRLFTWSFSIFHLLMPVLLIVGAALGRNQDAWQMLAFISIVTVQIATLTRASSLSQELHGRHYELLCLSPLRSGRIILHKWLSSLMFAPLFLASALPYVLMFYFLTHGDPLPMLLALFVGFLYAALTSALVIFASTLLGGYRELHPLRTGLSHSISALSLWLLFVLAYENRNISPNWNDAMLLGFLPIFSFLFLGLAASHLPRPGEIHTGKRRAALLIALPFTACLGWPAKFQTDAVLIAIGVVWLLVFLHDFFLGEVEPKKLPPLAERSWRHFLLSPGRLPAFCFHLSLFLQLALVLYAVSVVAPPHPVAKISGWSHVPAFIPSLSQLAVIAALSFLVHPFMALLHRAARQRREWRLVQLLLLPGLSLVLLGTICARPASYDWPDFADGLSQLVAFAHYFAFALPASFFCLVLLFIKIPQARRFTYFCFMLGGQIFMLGVASKDSSHFFVDIGEVSLPWLCLWNLLLLPVLLLCYRDDMAPRTQGAALG